MRPSTLSNMNTSAKSRIIAIKFYLKHRSGEGDRLHKVLSQIEIRTIVSMATDSFCRVIIEKML